MIAKRVLGTTTEFLKRLHTDGFLLSVQAKGDFDYWIEQRGVETMTQHIFIFKKWMQIILMSDGFGQEELSRAMWVSSQMTEPK